ncbi:MAG: PaREP1 family protein [Pyrobaculum sp.]
MSLTVTLPEKVREKAREEGVDAATFFSTLLDLVLEMALAKPLPHVEFQLRRQLAETYLEEGISLVEKNPTEASLKLYKAAEEAIKAIALALGLKNTWTKEEDKFTEFKELEKIVTTLAKKYGDDVVAWWSAAVTLYDLGYIEGRLGAEHVKRRIPYVQRLVNKIDGNKTH